MEFNPKYKIGDKIWAAFKHHEVTFDDQIPVVQMEIESIRFRGAYHGEEHERNQADFDYGVREIGGWSSTRSNEDQLFPLKSDAEKVAKEHLINALERNRATEYKLKLMLACFIDGSENELVSV